MQVSVWDDLIPDLDPLYLGNFVVPPIVILASVKVNIFKGESLDKYRTELHKNFV